MPAPSSPLQVDAVGAVIAGLGARCRHGGHGGAEEEHEAEAAHDGGGWRVAGGEWVEGATVGLGIAELCLMVNRAAAPFHASAQRDAGCHQLALSRFLRTARVPPASQLDVIHHVAGSAGPPEGLAMVGVVLERRERHRLAMLAGAGGEEGIKPSYKRDLDAWELSSITFGVASNAASVDGAAEWRRRPGSGSSGGSGGECAPGRAVAADPVNNHWSSSPGVRTYPRSTPRRNSRFVSRALCLLEPLGGCAYKWPTLLEHSHCGDTFIS